MNSSSILSAITFVYGLAGFLYIFAWVFKKPGVGRAGTGAAIIGLAGNTAGIILRWVESYKLGIGHAPLSNLYESLIFFAWTMVLIYLFIERKYANRIIGAFTTPLAFLALAYASLSPNIDDRIQPLIPALKSNWLIAHVITCFVGYGAFAVAFGISFMYLIKHRDPEGKSTLLSRFPRVNVLDELNHQLVMFGFLFLSAGIITGAVWANSAWGRYWGWDPKETWSLITWFIYATLLHARMMRGWHGKRIAYLSIAGFAAVLFTYFGVNYLPGLHSYQMG
ncbi:MAG: c-type cytochrome biogenesis protein CcsB [Desulfobacterales bacterium]|nr:MAG: c-type cytochrome biogenesis protein CcsB [Desulfobacterales bacterium]